MRKLLLACVALLPSQVQAREALDRFVLEARIVGGNSAAYPGHYVGIRTAGAVLAFAGILVLAVAG